MPQPNHDDSPYWPFRGMEKNECYGPGRRGGKNCRRDRWRCKCEQLNRDLSVCKCVSTRTLKNGKPSRAKKTVRINLQKKRKRQAQDRAARRR
jgi:hypothetical protein